MEQNILIVLPRYGRAQLSGLAECAAEDGERDVECLSLPTARPAALLCSSSRAGSKPLLSEFQLASDMQPCKQLSRLAH